VSEVEVHASLLLSLTFSIDVGALPKKSQGHYQTAVHPKVLDAHRTPAGTISNGPLGLPLYSDDELADALTIVKIALSYEQKTGGIHLTALRDLIMRSTSSADLAGPAYQAIKREERGGAFVNTHDLRLVGNISDISRAGLYGDHQERVTVSVEGAEPLYAELRLPNHAGWVLGQKVLVVIVPASPEGISDSQAGA